MQNQFALQYPFIDFILFLSDSTGTAKDNDSYIDLEDKRDVIT